jgi:hypothetical protein
MKPLFYVIELNPKKYDWAKAAIRLEDHYKIREKEGKTAPLGGWVLVWGGEDIRKTGQRVNMVEIVYAHVCKWKNETH